MSEDYDKIKESEKSLEEYNNNSNSASDIIKSIEEQETENINNKLLGEKLK